MQYFWFMVIDPDGVVELFNLQYINQFFVVFYLYGLQNISPFQFFEKIV